MRHVRLTVFVVSIGLSVALAGSALAQGRGGGPGGGGPGGGGGGGDTIDHTALQTLPIKLGTSGGNVNDIANGFCASGTLGALLRDDGSGDYFILSNAHVLAHDIDSSGTDSDVALVNDPIAQPGLIDTRCGRD